MRRLPIPHLFQLKPISDPQMRILATDGHTSLSIEQTTPGAIEGVDPSCSQHRLASLQLCIEQAIDTKALVTGLQASQYVAGNQGAYQPRRLHLVQAHLLLQAAFGELEQHPAGASDNHHHQ